MPKLRYSLLKYIPDPLGEEEINIGLIMDIGRELLERHLSSWEKVRAIDPDANSDLIITAIEVILDIIKKKRDFGDEILKRFQRNVRVSNPVEATYTERDDLLWIFETFYAKLVEGKKELPLAESSLRSASELIADPERRTRFERGDISRMEIAKIGKRDATDVEYITLLASSDDEVDWVAAWDKVSKYDIGKTELFTLISYRFWSVGKVEFAIRVAEKGLERVKKGKFNEKTTLRLKNNMAYYYAELRKPKDEKKARKYIDQAMKDAEDYEHIDTLGYVLISYGKNEEEILKGVELCEKARQKGESFHLYYKHVSRAYERLKEIGATS